MLLFAPGLCPANQTEPRAAIILPHFVHANPMLQQKLAMPLQPHVATIVLPAFARSCSADGKSAVVFNH